MTAGVDFSSIYVSDKGNYSKCPHLYAHFDCASEADPEIITDKSGNGHNLTWLNTTTVPSSYRQADHIEFPASPANKDIWVASSVSEFPFFDVSITSLYAFWIVRSVAATAIENIFAARGAAGGASDAGFQLGIDSTSKPRGILHDGSTTLASAITTNTVPLNRRVLIIAGFDASSDQLTVLQQSGYNEASPYDRKDATYSGTFDISQRDDIAAFGARSDKLSGSEKLSNTSVYDMQMYHDVAGGSLPDLVKVSTWMWHNPGKIIPKALWA